MKRGEVGAGRAVGVGAELAQNPDAVQVTDFHGVREVVEQVLVDQWDEADHEGHGAVASLHVGIAALLQQHVQQVVPELPVRDVSENTGQG